MQALSRLCLSLLALLASGVSLAADVRGLQSLEATHRHVLDSRATDHRYHVFVGLPDGYEDRPDKRYPAIYVLDGGELYPMFVTYGRYLNSNAEVPELIVVGISYGTRDWREGNDRSHISPPRQRSATSGAARRIFRRFSPPNSCRRSKPSTVPIPRNASFSDNRSAASSRCTRRSENRTFSGGILPAIRRCTGTCLSI